jgi:hypothetical protein
MKELRLELSSTNHSTGALMKLHSQVVRAKMSLRVGVDKEGFGTFYYYGNHLDGNRAYKLITRNPTQNSAALKLKAIDATQTLHIDSWSVQFYRVKEYDAVVKALITAKFFTARNMSCMLQPRTMKLVPEPLKTKVLK